MYKIEYLAAFLLFLRIASSTFSLLVVKRQIQLFKQRIVPALVNYRRLLFALSLVILLGNVIPIVIDIVTLFVDTSRPARVSTLSISYAVSNATTSLASSYMIWKLYRLAARNDDVLDHES